MTETTEKKKTLEGLGLGEKGVILRVGNWPGVTVEKKEEQAVFAAILPS